MLKNILKFIVRFLGLGTKAKSMNIQTGTPLINISKKAMSISVDKTANNWCGYSKLGQPDVTIRRFDNRSHRFYWWQEPKDGVLVTKTGIGVTSLLSMVMPESKPLTDWKIRTEGWQDILDASSDYGTMMHQVLQKWLLDKSVPKELLDAAREPCIRAKMNPDMPEKDLLAWALFCEEYQVEPLLIEGMLISKQVGEDGRYCQAVDLLCGLTIDEIRIEMVDEGEFKSGPRKGEQKLIEKKTKVPVHKIVSLDWKSNFASKDAKAFFASHKFQLIAAQRAVEYNFPDIKVDLLINWAPVGWHTRPSYTIKIWDVTQQDQDLFDAYINIAHVSGFFKPTGSIFVAPEFIPETTSNDFKLLSYEEFVEKIIIPGLNNVQEDLNEDNQYDVLDDLTTA